VLCIVVCWAFVGYLLILVVSMWCTKPPKTLCQLGLQRIQHRRQYER
jgi:hypothetical protein